MNIDFFKYQGTGNDFIIIDNRQYVIDKNDTKLIRHLCDRRFGIGADGVILLEDHESLDFKMVYFNSDGNESTMCGNGGRCVVKFAQFLNIIDDEAVFEAIDGVHKAFIEGDLVKLQMKDVQVVKDFKTHVFLDTGSPHHVQMESDLNNLNVKSEGSKIRYSHLYGEIGCNINFVEKLSETEFAIRTYERGVEDETLSCGTGVTATAIAMRFIEKTKSNEVYLKTLGGNLQVTFKVEGNSFKDIWLIGPAEQVFKGNMEW